eukprot:COSAG02_NODE_15175_length_1197_cov_1.088342_3_plen_158_part_01
MPALQTASSWVQPRNLIDNALDNDCRYCYCTLGPGASEVTDGSYYRSCQTQGNSMPTCDTCVYTGHTCAACGSDWLDMCWSHELGGAEENPRWAMFTFTTPQEVDQYTFGSTSSNNNEVASAWTFEGKAPGSDVWEILDTQDYGNKNTWAAGSRMPFT